MHSDSALFTQLWPLYHNAFVVLKKNGVTKKMIAEAADLTPSYLSQLDLRSKEPSRQTVIVIGRVLLRHLLKVEAAELVAQISGVFERADLSVSPNFPCHLETAVDWWLGQSLPYAGRHAGRLIALISGPPMSGVTQTIRCYARRFTECKGRVIDATPYEEMGPADFVSHLRERLEMAGIAVKLPTTIPMREVAEAVALLRETFRDNTTATLRIFDNLQRWPERTQQLFYEFIRWIQDGTEDRTNLQFVLGTGSDDPTAYHRTCLHQDKVLSGSIPVQSTCWLEEKAVGNYLSQQGIYGLSVQEAAWELTRGQPALVSQFCQQVVQRGNAPTLMDLVQSSTGFRYCERLVKIAALYGLTTNTEGSRTLVRPQPFSDEDFHLRRLYLHDNGPGTVRGDSPHPVHKLLFPG